MPRQKTGEKLGRPFIYTNDEERPVTVSLRIKRDLFDRLEAYRKIHRQSVTELLIEGLKWRLDEEEDPRWPSQNGVQHYGNTTMTEEASLRQPAPPVPLTGMDLTPVMVDTADMDERPLAPVAIAPQSAEPVPAGSPQSVTLGDKARVLAQLHAWKAAGVSLQTMADRLNASAVPTFSGKGTWKKGTIGNLLAPRQAAPVA